MISFKGDIKCDITLSALRPSGPSDLQTKCLIFGFCCGLPLAQVKIITATAKLPHHNQCQQQPPSPCCRHCRPTFFASVSFLCTPPSLFRLIMLCDRGWFMAFGRTVTELVNLLYWSVVGTTAALLTETPPRRRKHPLFLLSFRKVSSLRSPFSLPHAPD